MFAVPFGPPGQPVVDSMTSNSIALIWNKPRDAGNGKLQGYIVEMKLTGGDWKVVKVYLVREPEMETTTALLVTNPYVVVLAVDFSMAFDSVRLVTVLVKYSLLDIPDNIYCWIESFFRDHSHCTRFGDKV